MFQELYILGENKIAQNENNIAQFKNLTRIFFFQEFKILLCSIQLCYPYNCLYTVGPKKNMWVSGFPTLPSFWTPKSRHSIGRQPVGPLRGEKSGNYLSYRSPGDLRGQNHYSVIQFYSELLPFTGCRYVN